MYNIPNKIPPSFEKRSEPVEELDPDSVYDEDYVFSDIRIDDYRSKILMRDGRVFIEYEIIEDYAKDKDQEELSSWDFYTKRVRRKDLDPYKDFVKNIIDRIYCSGHEEDLKEEYNILEDFMRRPIEDKLLKK